MKSIIHTIIQNTQKKLIKWGIGIVIFLILPLILTLTGSGVDGDGFHWTFFDFVFIFVIMFGSAVAYELISKVMPNLWYKAGVGVAVVTSLLLVWTNAVIEIIGDGPINMLYFALLAGGLVSVVLVRFKPREMSYIVFAMAFLQALIPLITLVTIERADSAPAVLKIFALNAGFALMYVVSGLLFRNVGKDIINF